ncbi:MAG: hypothetical protein ACM35G_04570 [Planctomycetaceae bacterium]
MIDHPPAVRRTPRAGPFLLGFFLSAIGIPNLALAKLETWRQETSAAFTKGHRERVVVSDSGRVRLGQALGPLATLDAVHVWDLARTGQGVLYAATGDEGKVFRREDKDDAPWTVAYDAADTQALALAVLPDGRIFAGTGPTGQVVEVSDPMHPASRPDSGVQYIWDLAADPQGDLYAATGPTGQLWKRSPEGRWSLLLDSKHPHLLCVAVGPDGSIYAGSDGEGLIYRVATDGKAAIVYDAPQDEVRVLLFAPDGTLYAGTAAESGGGPGRGNLPSPPGGLSGVGAPSGGAFAAVAGPPAAAAPEPPTIKPSAPISPAGGSASPRPVSPGDNAVYRIGPDGIPREVLRVKALVFALAWRRDRLLVGTGPEGQLYEVRDPGRESTPLAKLDHGQILSMVAEPQGGLLLGAGSPGAVVRLKSGHVDRGTLVSDVHDTRLISRFGALSWRAERPEGTSVALQVRTGNVGEPDATWSLWSAEQTDPASARAIVPPGRFVQYRVTLSTHNPDISPELRSVTLRYQTANLPPEITRIDVPDLGASDGATRQTRLSLRWDVSDPNGDDLNYTLHIRKDGWPDRVRLGEGPPQTESSYSWDTTTVPAGLYRVRITASDRPSNNPGDALTCDRESEAFIVDHEAPGVTIIPEPRGAVVALKDGYTRLVKAAYALDGGEWTPIFPDDGLFDTADETITINIPDLKPGMHILVIRATDAAGNIGTGDAVLDVR